MKNFGAVEYKMSKQHFDAILATRKSDEKKMNPYVFVMKILNEQYGIRGEVKKLLIEM